MALYKFTYLLTYLLTDLTLQITKKTALMAAASRGSAELCRALLSAGSRVDDVTDHVTFTQKQLVQKNKLREIRAGTHAVHEAARGAHLKVLQVSLSRDIIRPIIISSSCSNSSSGGGGSSSSSSSSTSSSSTLVI